MRRMCRGSIVDDAPEQAVQWAEASPPRPGVWGPRTIPQQLWTRYSVPAPKAEPLDGELELGSLAQWPITGCVYCQDKLELRIRLQVRNCSCENSRTWDGVFSCGASVSLRGKLARRRFLGPPSKRCGPPQQRRAAARWGCIPQKTNRRSL